MARFDNKRTKKMLKRKAQKKKKARLKKAAKAVKK